MSAFGLFGATEENPSPFVTIDNIDYPLVPQSIVEGAPLNPFSPSNTDGNSVAVVSQRHASEVWDDLTAGIGFRDDEPGSHQYCIGNLDVRVPAAWTLPHLGTEYGSGGAVALPYTVTNPPYPIQAQYVGNNTSWAFLTWQHGDVTAHQLMRKVTAGGVGTVGITDGFFIEGVAQYLGDWYVLVIDLSSNARMYKSTGAGSGITFTQVGATVTTTNYSGLVNFDNKLITYDNSAKTFKQWDTGLLAWAAYVGGYTQRFQSEVVRQLFVWTDKSGSRDALYLLTDKRLLVYDEEGAQWEELYTLGDLFLAQESFAHVNRRDNTLVVTTSSPPNAGTPLTPESGTILVFTPGTVDNIGINKGYGFPANSAFNTLGSTAPVNHVMTLASGIHWLFAWCFAPLNLGSGVQGGVYAFNEFGGWTQVFDPAAIRNNTTASVVGGGYGSGKLLTILSDGSYYVQADFDMNLQPPFGLYDSQAAGSAHDYFIRSGRIYNKQRNIKKLGSHIEVTFSQPLPSTTIVGQGPAYLKYRFFNENGLSAWQTSSAFVSGAQRMSISLTDGAGSNGIQYYYMEWELHLFVSTLSAIPPVVESLVLYYTYFQTNRYAYSFNIDLTAETWKEYYPDGTFHGNSREYLQTQILAMADKLSYHTFNYSQLFFTESVSRADTLLARRESSDDASGVYSVTVRDLEPDGQSGVFYAG